MDKNVQNGTLPCFLRKNKPPNELNCQLKVELSQYKITFTYSTDATCIVWGGKCGVDGNCWLYDGQRLKYYLNITGGSKYYFLNSKIRFLKVSFISTITDRHITVAILRIILFVRHDPHLEPTINFLN